MKAITEFFDSIWKIMQFFGIIILVIFILREFNNSAEGLTIGNIKANTYGINFNLSNTSNQSNDVLIWVEQDGYKRCEHIIHINEKWSYKNIKIPCQLREGKFTLRHIWAAEKPGEASIATRIKSP